MEHRPGKTRSPARRPEGTEHRNQRCRLRSAVACLVEQRGPQHDRQDGPVLEVGDGSAPAGIYQATGGEPCPTHGQIKSRSENTVEQYPFRERELGLVLVELHAYSAQL